MSNGYEVDTQDILLTQIIAAPLGNLWNAWTNCEDLKRWWGPKGYTCPDCRIDLRVGGTFFLAMQAPPQLGDRRIYTAGKYARILPGRSLEFSQYMADRAGRRIDPARAGLPADFPAVVQTVVGLEAKGDMDQSITELTLTVSGWTRGDSYDLALTGWRQAIDKLVELVERK